MTTHADWQYIQNQFLNALENSYKSTNIFAKDHVSSLANFKTDTDIIALFNRTEPVYDAFQVKYTLWKKAVSFYKGTTSVVDNLLLNYRVTLVPRWDIKIQSEYMASTPEYLTLIPNGRTSMYTGGKDTQIQTIRTLSESLLEYSNLATLQTEVNDYYVKIEKARDTQQQQEQTVQDAADELRKAQTAVCVMMYRNLGRLMDKYAEDTLFITKFYQLNLIRNVASDSKTNETEVEDIAPDMPNDLSTDEQNNNMSS